MHILFTRPEIDSVYSAKKFIQLGHQVSVFPILNIVKKKTIDINFTNYNSVVFTSSNAALCLDQNIQSNVRCFCVGEANVKLCSGHMQAEKSLHDFFLKKQKAATSW